MRSLRIGYGLGAALLAAAGSASGQSLECIDPPAASGSEAACEVAADTVAGEYRVTLRLRAANAAPIANRLVTFTGTGGTLPDTARTDAEGYVGVTWRGAARAPVLITATAAIDSATVRRQIRIAVRESRPPPYIAKLSPRGYHSAFAGRFLTDDIEVEIHAEPETCNRTRVIFEYLSAGTSSAPAPVRFTTRGLWSELDPGRFGCAAQLRWALSPAVGEQTLRAWIARDSSFVVPPDDAGAQRYLRPHVVHAVAHAPPAFLAGAAVIDSAGAVPKLVGVDLSFPTVADRLKHWELEPLGDLVDRTRIFLGTEFGGEVGKTLYVGVEPLVLMVGPRAADVPVALAVGRRMGPGTNRWFLAGLVNAGGLAGIVATGLGIK